MRQSEFEKECLMGGPGLDGYAYLADTYCADCAAGIVDAIKSDIAPKLSGTTDPLFSDSEICPQPIFFGEHETEQNCGKCGKFLYGGNLDMPFSGSIEKKD